MVKRVLKLLIELLLLVAVAFGAVKLVEKGFDHYYRMAYPMKYTALIDQACLEKGLDRALVYAVVRTESDFDPTAQSHVGARGLMQMMPDAYNWVRMRRGEAQTEDLEPLYDPQINVDYGTDMLRLLLDEFGNDHNALAAYHGGWGSVKEWLKNPEYAPDGKTVTNIPFQDTSAYVEKVLKTKKIYQKLYKI